MAAEETTPGIVYLIGLMSDEVRQIRNEFQSNPIDDRQVEVLQPGSSIPLSLLAGQAVLIIGCGGGYLPNHDESIWFLRVFACGCPWVALTGTTHEAIEALCEVAGAVSHLSRPFLATELRKIIPQLARHNTESASSPTLDCEQVLRYLALLEADILLRVSTESGDVGFLSIRQGEPIHALVPDGSTATDALREILKWTQGRILGLPLDPQIQPNLPSRPEAWSQLLRAAPRHVPGGREACDLVLKRVDDVIHCAMVDLRSHRIVAAPSTEPMIAKTDSESILSLSDLLRTALNVVASESFQEEPAEVLIVVEGGWWAATRLNLPHLGLVVSGSGHPNLGFAREAFLGAAAEIDRHSGAEFDDRFDPIVK